MNLLQIISVVSLIIGGLSCIIILIDIISGHTQKMTIMNIVWPVTGLYAGPIGLLAYFKIGRKSITENGVHIQGHDMKKMQKPFWQSVVVGTLHCGAGCTLGDIIAEFGLLIFPITLFGSILYGSWMVDFFIAFILGIIFQYYAIRPMRDGPPSKIWLSALKADTLSLASWQIGMYGMMAIAVFIIFNRRLEATEPLFWFIMQGGMLLGFCTAFPVNWWLIKKGIKEKM